MKFLILCVCTIVSICFAHDRLTGPHFTTRSEVLAQSGMAASSQPLVSQVALDILKKGGNAMDAAIAANAVNTVVEPMSCGIGGDLFAIVWNAKERRLYGLNASGRSPQSLTLQEFRTRGMEQIPIRGPLSVSTPGCVDGWFELHDKFGTLSMQEILQPAIDYAEKGFPVTEVIAQYWQGGENLADQPGFAEVLLPEKRAPEKGEIFKNPALARTLSLIAEKGREVFYKGEIATKLEAFLSHHGGYLQAADLATHTSTWIEPVSASYRGVEVWELPPNGQGIAALQILNVLEGYDIANMGFGSADYIHTLVEAKKLAFEDRAKYYADPDFNDIPVKQLISKSYADQRRRLIDPDRAADRYDPGDIKPGDTIYLTVADKDGNMVSLIQSLFYGFGSGLVPPELGFSLQNRGSLFTLQDDHFNRYEPGKRPFHTIIPAFVTKDGEPFLSFGVMGGDMQPQGHAQILVNVIDFGMNLQEAGDAPRIRHIGSSQPTGIAMTDGGYVVYESGFAPEVIRDLIRRGHDVRKTVGGFGGYQAVGWDARNRVYIGASESRKDGHAAGY
jgi:gamma-glutamyltranspeptidase / glutathione hydrolase